LCAGRCEKWVFILYNALRLARRRLQKAGGGAGQHGERCSLDPLLDISNTE
jgi:hypothetical protein